MISSKATRFVFCLLLSLAGVTAACDMRTGTSSSSKAACANTQAETVAIGLFIGINEYCDSRGRIREEARLTGAVNDARRMQSVFRERFRLTDSLLLLNEHATRAEIGRAFLDILRRAEKASGQQVRVVVFYAGHGDRVLDQDGDEGPGGLDSTWVCHDGFFGDHADQIRDDDVHEFVQRLCASGAQVLLISDSCHSGTLHRGVHVGVRPREFVDRATAGKPQAGPRANLLPGPYSVGDRPDPEKQLRRREWPESGFVGIFAARDEEKAWEDVGANSAGRLTVALTEAIGRVEPGSTYLSVYSTVLETFARRFTIPSQSPQMHASRGMGTQPFFHGGATRNYARVLSLDHSYATLSLGRVSGVSERSSFDLFSSLEAMDRGEAPLGVAQVDSVEPDSCRVTIPGGVTATLNWAGRLRGGGLDDLPIFLAADVPETIARPVHELASKGRITLTQTPSGSGVIVAPVPGTSAVGLYSPAEVPPRAGDPDGPGGPAIPLATASDAEGLQRELLARAQVRRVWTLSGAGSSIAITLRETESGVEQGGVTVVVEVGRTYELRATNTGDVPLYLSVLQPSDDSRSG